MEPSGRTRQPATLRPMSDDAPKSAFELAMQRLQQKDKEANVGDRPLTDAQKAAIAEVRQVFTAKSAEREILHRAALRKAGTREEVELLNEIKTILGEMGLSLGMRLDPEELERLRSQHERAFES